MKQRSRISILIGSLSIAASLTGSVASAQNLNSPFSLDTADTLPRNVRSPRFINVFGSTTERFANAGTLEGLGAQLNKLVLWKDVIREQEDDGKRTLLRGALKQNGISEDGSPGFTAGEVNTFATVRVAALAWGITDQLTIAGVLPLVKVDVSAATGFAAPSAESDYAKLSDSMARTQSPAMRHEVQTKFDNAIARKLARLGYEPISASQTISGVGDAQLVAKYRVFNDGVNGVALKGNLIFPTGTPPNADKALDIPTGNGRFGTGVGVVYDRKLPFGIRWNNATTYTAMLPRHEVRRIPTSVSDMLSADKEEMYERTRHQFALGSGLDYLFEPIGLILGTGYSFQFLTRANYEFGTTYDPARYYLLDDARPAQALHSGIVSASFSTVHWFRQKKFFLPFQVNVSYSHPLAGRNVPAGRLLAGELVAFF
jgi:hypothetical protein